MRQSNHYSSSEIDRLVAAVRQDPACLSELLSKLERVVHSLAWRYPGSYHDDLVNVANYAIWQAAVSPDLRPVKTRNYLMSSAIFAMTKYADKMRRQHKRANTPWRYDVEDRTSPALASLPPLLSRYLDYINENGTIKGAHSAIARERGVTRATMLTLFRKVSRSYRERMLT